MAGRALAALRHIVTVEWPKLANAEAKELLLRTAREGHDRIIREQALRAGVIPEWNAYANFPGNTNLESVKLPGPIVYRYYYFRELLLVAIRELEKASPRGPSGKYKTSHMRYDDGVPTRIDAPVKPGVPIWIANPVPYSRRLEVGKTDSGRDFLVSVPNRIYERVAKNILIPRYKNVANIRHGYVTLPGAWIIKGRLGPTYLLASGKKRKRRQQIGEKVRAPAIFIGLLT